MILPFSITTKRLLLRPTQMADATVAFNIQSNREVTRMLRLAPFPPSKETMQTWFEGHEAEWNRGEAYRFSIILEQQMIGMADINRISDEVWDIGYWLAKEMAGKGIASEAAEAMVDVAFNKLMIPRLVSGHAIDNPASGRVLQKQGFEKTGITSEYYLSRKTWVHHQHYQLLKESFLNR